jgi:hypothetical protein
MRNQLSPGKQGYQAPNPSRASTHLPQQQQLPRVNTYRIKPIRHQPPSGCGGGGQRRTVVGDGHRRRGPPQVSCTEVLSGGPYTVWPHLRQASGVSAAVTEARLMANQHPGRGPQGVPCRASARRVSDPLSGRRLHQLAPAQHNPMATSETRDSTKHEVTATLRRAHCCRFRSCW